MGEEVGIEDLGRTDSHHHGQNKQERKLRRDQTPLVPERDDTGLHPGIQCGQDETQRHGSLPGKQA
ncbi:MAG: hypothetical protein WCT32_05730 [Patescibacteria group bacterium]